MRHEYERKGTFTVYGPGELVLCEVIRSVSWVLPVASTEATISSIFLSELSASCARLIALPSSLRSSTASQESPDVSTFLVGPVAVLCVNNQWLANGPLIAATRRPLKDRSPLQYSSFGRFNVLPRNRPCRSKPPAPAYAPAGTTPPTDVLHPHERQAVGLAVNGYLDSDAESRDREEHLRKRSSHLFQGRAKYRTASPGREGDEPAFQAQLTGFGLYPKNAISYPAGRCRKFVIHVRPQRRADIPSNLPGTCSFHCPAEELSRPGPVRSDDPFTPFVADSPFG